MNFVEVKKQDRNYIYPCGIKIFIENIIKIDSSGTTHKLEDINGKKYIMNSGWIYIEILNCESWTY